MCVKDTGTKYQLWISDFNIDGTFTRVHPFIISHTKTMTRTREDGKEEVFSACIKHDDTRYLGGNKNSSVGFITEFDFRFGPYFVPNKVGTNKKADYNLKRGSDGQDTDKAVRVLLLGGGAHYGSSAGSGFFYSNWVRSGSLANVGFFTTVKLD